MSGCSKIYSDLSFRKRAMQSRKNGFRFNARMFAKQSNT